MNDDLNKPPYLEPDALGMYISAIYRHMQILVSADLQPYRIGSGQLSFLLMIATEEGLSQKKLSEELLIDKTTTAKAIGKLEAEGYVHREVDPTDKRHHRLYLTEAGKEVIPKIEEVAGNITRRSLSAINDEEAAILMSALHKVLGNVSEQVDNVRGKRKPMTTLEKGG